MPRDDSHTDLPDDVLSDAVLLLRYANGDQTAAQVLTARLTPRVYNHAVRLLGDRAEAEDVTQDALIRLWKIAPDWRQGEALVTTWLFRVTANLCTDRLRKRRNIGLDQIADPADPGPSVVVQMQDRARIDALQSALDLLPERQRQAVVLRHIEGLANPEIGAIMDISARAVESLTARGKRGLSEILAGRQEELGYDDG